MRTVTKKCGTCKHMSRRTFDYGMGLMAHRCDQDSPNVGVQKHSPCYNGKWEHK